jgi:hypothetical protein
MLSRALKHLEVSQVGHLFKLFRALQTGESSQTRRKKFSVLLEEAQYRLSLLLIL